jgi:hypothetical protein
MGVATTRTMERVAATVGLLPEAPIRFEPVLDVPHGGCLLAVPALLAFGLLRHTRDYYSLPNGFYGIESIFLLLALMALARIKSPEALRYTPSGEWGKILGLDRIPEVKTLREKLSLLCAKEGQSKLWSTKLASEWMHADGEGSGVFYVDGHVRVYHGEKTKLPRRYVTRERLCLRGTTDYWINALGGAPYFVLSKPVDPGLVKVLREEIVPWLNAQLPQDSSEEVAGAGMSRRHRFTLVFDREGYSPELFGELVKQGIAILTYRKSPGEDWSREEFTSREVRLINGETVQMELAERGVFLGDKIWVREIRKLGASGHQTAIVTTDYHTDATRLAAAMFARWCQENFFKYMREHFNIDRLIEYGTESIPDVTRVVNPGWREVSSQMRKAKASLSRQQALFGALHLPDALEAGDVEIYQKEKAQIHETIVALREDIEKLKIKRRAVAHYTTIAELPPEERFTRLAAEKKHFSDTIKMIAYRAETAMTDLLKEHIARSDDGRVLIRQLYANEVDLMPEAKDETLTIRLHHLGTHAHDEAIRQLCEELTATETRFPGTNLRLIYKLGST